MGSYLGPVPATSGPFFSDVHGGQITVIDITEEYLKERIYEIRGQRVILDADLSEIYGYTTKAFNQQVKNNIEKFDEDFMFELTDDEVERGCEKRIVPKKKKDQEFIMNSRSFFLL